MRLDTAEDVNRAVARFLELVKLAALIQRPGGEPAPRDAGGDQRAPRAGRHAGAAGGARGVGARRVRARRGAGADGAAATWSRRGTSRRSSSSSRAAASGLALSASDIDLYRTCPLKYKFARVFAIPQEPTINQRFGILIHQVLERFHAEELRGASATTFGGSSAGSSTGCWRCSRPAGAGRASALPTTSSSTATAPSPRSPATTSATLARRRARSGSSAASRSRSAPHQLRGRVDRVDRLADGAYELIDYKTGERKAAPELGGDLQLALYRLGAREAWRIDAELGSYWYVLDDEKVPVPAEPDDAERVERTVLEVAEGIEGQDFEPRPSYEICSWCDYRLICPASEA